MVAPTYPEGLSLPEGWRVSAEQRKQVLAHLGTDEERLTQDARSLRAWFNMQPHLPFLPESEVHMIKSYLLNCKNSMEKTKLGLDTYFTARTAHYKFFGSYNINEKELLQYSKYMSIGLSKELTPDLRRVVVACIHPTEQNDEEYERMCRLNLLKADTFMRMDTSLGLELIIDVSQFTASQAKQMVMSLNVLGTFLTCVMGALPARVKHLHLVNPPPFYAASFSLIQPLLKEKLRNRVIMHHDLKSLYSYVSPKYLPKELGGHLPSCQEIEDEFRSVFCSFGDFYAVQRRLKVDESKRPGGPSKMHAGDQFGCEGSFRKLALD